MSIRARRFDSGISPLLGVGVLVTALACAGVGREDLGLAGHEWVATLAPEGGFVGLEGTVSAVTMGHSTTAVAQIEGSTPGAIHPWHIHRGECGSGGPILGEREGYRPLRVAEDGRAEASATVNIQLDPEVEYHINVHESPDETGTVIACGSLIDGDPIPAQEPVDVN